MDNKESILIVDDDESTRRSLTLVFGEKGYVTETAGTGQEAIEKAHERFFNLALLDIKLPDMEGIELLSPLKEIHPDMVVIMATAYASVETAVRALNEGASAYIHKPLNMDAVLATVNDVLEKQRLVVENRKLYQEAQRELAERKRAEEALRQSEDKFSKAFHGSPDWVTITTLKDGRYIDVNDAFLRITGFSRDEVIGRTSIELGIWVDPEDHKRALLIVEREGALRDLEVRHRMKSGEIRTFLMSSVKIDLADEICLISVSRDITDRKSLEQQLLHSQKMEAIGKLAGGLAHDLNNVMTAIMSCSSFLLMGLSPEDPLRRDAQDIKKAGKRAAHLIRQIMAFGRRQVLHPRVFDLNTAVADMEEMLRHLIGENIDMVAALEPELGLVKADIGQIEQVIMNLVVNAGDAMPRGGHLTIETNNVDFDESYANKNEIMQPGPYVMLAVSDTGIGMDAKTQAQIFEPFFSTKEMGTGSGLGLSTVHGIVKQSGGYIRVYSKPGQGTTFKIYLPLIEGVVEPTKLNKAQVESLQGSETILLVEDDDMVRNSALRTLQQYGYQVLEAKDGKKATKICQQHEGLIHLMLTDVVMPGMSGKELAERMESLYPEMKMVYMSGYVGNIIANHGVVGPRTNFIHKPFAPEVLAKKVRNILNAPHSSKQ